MLSEALQIKLFLDPKIEAKMNRLIFMFVIWFRPSISRMSSEMAGSL